ncbi:MAG: NAD-glutamate dehydrogenase [Pseudomonadota bacterium]
MSVTTVASSAPREQLAEQFCHQADNEDLSRLAISDPQKLADAIWDLVETALAGGTQVRIRHVDPVDAGVSSRSVLECCGPDMPFLVDSLLNAASSQGLEVLALFHPIITLDNGSRVSAIQVHLPRLSDREADLLKLEAVETLDDVALAVHDYQEMRKAMRAEINRLQEQAHLPAEFISESSAFLEWLASEHFVFLGKRTYEFPRDSAGDFIAEEPEMVDGSNLGLLKDEDLNVLTRSAEPTVLTPEIGAFVGRREPIIIAKSTMLSRVHRRVAADYVGIKHYDDEGRVCGETRFLGLFTSEAYDETARSIPLVRKRVQKIIANSGAREGSHDGKALLNILERWPRDELLQSTAETLTPLVVGALHLIGRPRTRVFLRFDEFDRFVTALVYAPRESYDTRLRMQIGEALEATLAGEVMDFEPRFDTAALVRVVFHIRVSPGHPRPDPQELEAAIAELARTWDDSFRDALASAELEDAAAKGAPAFRGAFNAAYREAFTPHEALIDVQELSELNADETVRVRAFRLPSDPEEVLRAKIYVRDGAIPLSRCVPVFENMGLFVNFEIGYPVTPTEKPAADAPDTYWIHHVKMKRPDTTSVSIEDLAERFQDAFVAVWTGEAENDGYNQLVIGAGATWREAALLRALAAFRHQSGRDPGRATQIKALAQHPDLTRQLIDLFAARLDPAGEPEADLEARQSMCEEVRAEIESGLVSVSALDDDRVIRRIADLIMAIVRTNYFQSGRGRRHKRAISFKIASQEIEELPAPKPFREIFVAGPSVEGVHCRFGRVARGGLRWSDRRDDFRTEVLGLVKAQQVKNAVIVPVGSKGGFYPKQLPTGGSREEIRQAGISAYKTFISSLLDLTDNLVNGEVRPPDDTVVWDGDDPYLVVAADKGTATFSDIANEISEAHGFWLGDAFASGGSAGYDHKAMGITARGGWEAVKRHFREMGKDIQSEPFTVIGVGDMSGDVFGNGMLLSKQIRLQAAFNHMHIFVDPNPGDPERLWEERKRIFDLPRSSWADYDTSLISEGGGVFDRAAKSITLNDPIREMTGLVEDKVTPNELIHAILKMDAELLWFGGIGTYVKSASETHSDAGDRANDALRVDGRELNVSVVGEGANLGMTQAARIEFARSGGHINTDAIDNSAGVDSSDHEVNIKILAGEAIRRGTLPSGERNILLKSMTDDVAEHVLAHNYDQTAALTLAQDTALNDMEALERLMVDLEERGVLNRALEGLPPSAEMVQRQEAGAPLTRPELSVLLAWSKITLFDDLVASDVPDDPSFEETLTDYFPKAIREHGDSIKAHRLKREIVSTVLANRVLDAGGPVFLSRLRESTDRSNTELTRAFEIGRRVLNLSGFKDEVDALDNKVPAAAQTSMHKEGAGALFRAIEIITMRELGATVAETADAISAHLDKFKSSLRETASPHAAVRIERRARDLMGAEVPEPLARWSAALPYFAMGIRLVDLADEGAADIETISKTYFEVGDALRLDRLRVGAEDALTTAGYWDRVATRRMIDELVSQKVEMTRQALNAGSAEAWLAPREAARKELMASLRSLADGHSWSFSRFALAVDAVRRFATFEA